MTPPVQKVRSFVAWAPLSGAAAPESAPAADARRTRLGSITVEWIARSADAQSAATGAAPGMLVLGDDAELDAARPDRCLASGVPIRLDAHPSELVLHTSIVGLPPVMLYRDTRVVALTSDVHMLRRVPGVQLRFDERAIVELARIGHPVAHRTLFAGLELVRSGARVHMHADGSVSVTDAWRLPDANPLGWDDYIDAQIAAFSAAVDRIDVKRSFLSLTAGLDTRTVFASLADRGRLVPTATMTGPKRSLDARAAAKLSDAYGVAHHAVTFDERYVRELPALIERANLLSGGLASLDQAPEVWFYQQLGRGFEARLSGNLGNQVGRGGTEGVSTRDADDRILAASLRNGDGGDDGHWLLSALGTNEQARLEFILKNEIVFTLVNNYPVGNHFAAQQTPYASRELIDTLANRPRAGASMPSGSMIRMRMRDLAHRFLGESEDRSFQRKLLRRIDGYAARYPINWGWRASGGVSPTGAALGVATLFGMYARARGLDGGVLRRPLAWTGLPALHDFRESRAWLREGLETFTRDTLTSGDAASLFDPATMRTILDEHFAGTRDHYHTVTFALDVAMAHRNFCTRTVTT